MLITSVFKLVIVALLSGIAASAPSNEQVLEVLEGIIVGAIDSEVPSLQTCVNDVLEDIGRDIVESVKQLEDQESLRLAKKSIHMIGDSFVSLADVVSDCGLAVQEVEKLQNIGANFADPVTFAYHVGKDLIVNGVSIYDDVQLAITDYHDENWFDMGVQIGSAVALAMLGSTELPLLTTDHKMTAALQVLEGVISGAVDAELPNVETCATDVLEEIGQDIVKSVAELKLAADREDAESSVHAIGDSFVCLADAVKDCGLAVQEVEKLQKIGANFADPATFAYHVGKDLIVNGVSIYDDVQLAITDYHDENWFDMGVQVGEVVALAMLGSDLPVLADAKMQ
mmetsp:Transcript_5266/g.8645  ORF Transcript_5266/g.8645 Transcript_5266/m.8645 type:complete len:341 (+) Transcript_5266:143-1165(+)